VLILGPFNETVLNSYPVVDPFGGVATQQHLASGIVMSVLPICSSPTTGNTVQQLVIRGYLVPAS
jgi:hypothetical protein